jgi:pyruvate/2-oxoglutarate dehydrogenase complex dihydrolipoamide dehydrogenase (E3) component
LGKQGIETVLVEQSEKMYSDTCINIACIPTKAQVMQAVKHTPYAAAVGTKDELIAALRRDPLLRRFREQARHQTLPPYSASGSSFCRTRQTVNVVL